MIKEIENRIQTEVSFVKNQIESYLADGKRIFASSSFQSHSIPMLHILSQIDSNIEIYFVDTGFHFPETIVYREQVQSQLDLNVKVVESDISKIDLLNRSNKFLFTTDPDYCCHINKVSPIDKVALSFDVWITGVRKDQSKVRSDFGYEAMGRNGIKRFHPMINWDDKMINLYINRNNLPSHPLESEGYNSVGCAPCTGKPRFDERSGRWVGMNKTECGLHLDVT